MKKDKNKIVNELFKPESTLVFRFWGWYIWWYYEYGKGIYINIGVGIKYGRYCKTKSRMGI